MNYTERHIGTATLVEKLPDETLEMQCLNILGSLYNPDEGYYENAIEALEYEYYKKYIVIGNDLYKLDDTEEEDEEYYCDISRIDDKTFKYETRFYNGCDWLNSMIKNKFKTIKSNMEV